MNPTPLVVAVAAALCASLPAQLATFTTSAAGCPTPNAPTLSMTGGPVIGTTPVLVANGLPGDSLLAFAFLGLSQSNIPLDFLGATGCFALAGAELGAPTMALSVPTATLPIAIPNSTAYLGLVLEVQAGALAPSANAFGLATTDRGTMVVGSERLLRDASGYPNNPGFTSGQPLLPIYSTQSGSGYALTGVPVTFTAPTIVSKLSGVGNSPGGSMSANWIHHSWALNIWQDTASTTARQEFEASPLQGNYTSNLPLVESHQNFNGDWVVDLAPQMHIVIPAGAYWFAVKATFAPAATGVFGFRHSNNPSLASDYFIDDTMNSSLSYTSYGLTPGAAAFDIVGY